MLESPRLSKTSNCILYKTLAVSKILLSYKFNIIVYKVLLNKPMEISAVISGGRLAIFDTPTHNPFQGLEELRIQL